MNGFIKSFYPILKRLKKYLLEIVILIVALVITIASLIIYTKNNKNSEEEIETNSPRLRQDFGGQSKIFVDISGAVKKASVYEMSFGARLKDVLDRAGGLSDDADTVFFFRNFNLAQIVSDQEKIYIPSTTEINNDVFIENPRVLDYSVSRQVPASQADAMGSSQENAIIINLNSATIEELDQLPGIGQITANKIIANRPYIKADELLTKKVVNKGVFEKIKDSISTN